MKIIVAIQMQILMENGVSLRILLAKTLIGDTASLLQRAAILAKMWRWHLHALVVRLGQTSRATTAPCTRPSRGAQKMQRSALDGTANGARSRTSGRMKCPRWRLVVHVAEALLQSKK